MLLKGEDVPALGVVASLLRNVGLNLWGLGATIVGLQVTTRPALLTHESKRQRESQHTLFSPRAF